MDFESMTIDELEAFLVENKRQRLALREIARQALAVRARRTNGINLAARLNVPIEGLDERDIDDLLRIANKPRPGDIVVTPEAAHIERVN